MRKFAFFVEGKTEAKLTKRLLIEVAEKNNLDIVVDKIGRTYSGATFTRSSTKKFFVLIGDCTGDTAVKPRIKDQEQSLVNSGYEKIIGLRDLYPRAKNDLANIKSLLYTGLTNVSIINIIIAVMEVEAWFIAESNHFVKAHKDFTNHYILSLTGFNPSIDDPQNISHPARMLKYIYQSKGLSYRKNDRDIDFVLDRLDYENIYFNLRQKIGPLDCYLNEIDQIA